VNKNGFKSVVLGLSGGIDSAICAAIAVDALGEERVRAIMLPYRYTSKESLTDAAACAKALGCHYDTVPIGEPVDGFLSALSDMFEGTESGLGREPAEPCPRHHPDGDLQQFGRWWDDPQQVGNVGRYATPTAT
jgi:NAD+ synthase